MPKYFFKKATASLILLSLCRISNNTGIQQITCSPETLGQLCKNQNKIAVCAIDSDSSYSTFNSACQACGNKDTISYTQGPCKCPDVPCNSQQTCIDNDCLKTSSLDVDQLADIAYKYLSEQKHTEALQYIQKAIKISEDDANLYYLASLATFGNDQPKQSLKFIKKAILLNPEVPEFYITRGRAFSEINQFEEADKQFRKVLEIGFDDIGLVYFYQGQNLLKHKKNEEAIKKFQSALYHRPQKTEWYVRKALAHIINNQQKMALLTCREGLKIDPQNQQIKLFMIQFKIIDDGKQKDIEKAQQKNQIPDDGSRQRPDPQYINRLIQQRRQEEIMNFQRQRLDEKKRKQQKYSKQKLSNKEIQL